MPHLIILTGAPRSADLNWDESHDKKHNENITLDSGEAQSNTRSCARWRQLRLPHENRVGGGLHSAPWPPSLADADHNHPLESEHAAAADHGSTAQSRGWRGRALDDFYEHSFALHEDAPPSQASDLQNTFFSASTSNMSCSLATLPSDARSYSASTPAVRLPEPGLTDRPGQHLTDVEDVPDARRLQSLGLDIITVNLIVGVLQISGPRVVTIGKGRGKGCEVELMELVVGDETKSGFAISMWLGPPLKHLEDEGEKDKHPAGSDLRRSLLDVRPRDILLIRSVALNSWQGRVQGQSLRRGMTKVDLLHRRKLDVADPGGFYSARRVEVAKEDELQVMKVRRVRDWMLNFVSDKSHISHKEMLPPDTQ